MKRMYIVCCYIYLLIFSIVIKGEEEIPKKYERIVTDSAIVSRVLDVLDIKLVGAPSSMTKIPKRYKNVLKIGRAGSPDYERIKSLNPDLVITTTFSKPYTSSRYAELKIPTLYIDLEGYESSKITLKNLGKILDRKELSENIIKKIEEREKKLEEKLIGMPVKRVAVLYNLDDNLNIISETHFVSELLKKLGCINVSKEVKGKINTRANVIPISFEQLICLNPDYILKISVIENEDDKLLNNKMLKVTNAYKNKKILNIDSTLFRMSSGINGIDALEELYKIIYEEREK